MKKMILMSMLVLSAGSLFGMENPEPVTVSDLYDAVLDNTNQVFGLSARQRLLNDLRDAMQVFNWDTIGGQNREQARLATDYFIETLEPYLAGDPKEFNLDEGAQEKLENTLRYLNKLRSLL